MEMPKLQESRNGCLWCLVCQVKTESMETFQTHLRSKSHLKSFTLRKIGHKSCYGCVACSLEFDSTEPFEKHIRSIRHREKVYLSHKSATNQTRGNQDVIYRCNICKFDTKSAEEHELHQYSAVHKSREQLHLLSFKRKGSARLSGQGATSPSCSAQSNEPSPIAADKKIPEVSKELSSFVEGFNEHYLETTVEMKAFLEPFYTPSNANKDGVKLCRKCGDVLPLPAIWNHIYEKHLRVRPFSCQQCGAKFCAEEDLLMHAQFTRHDYDAPSNKESELRILRYIFESRRKGKTTKPAREEEVAPNHSATKERSMEMPLPSVGASETPFVETGLRNFLMSQFPSSPKCLEKNSSASDLRAILRPYFAKFICTNSNMRLECANCRLEASNFWEHVYMMHLKASPFKCADCSHRELTFHRIDRHCKGVGHQQERNYEIAILKSALESVWPVQRNSGSVNVASASPSSLSSNSSSSSSSGYGSVSSHSGRRSADVDSISSSRSKTKSPERMTFAPTTALAQPSLLCPATASSGGPSFPPSPVVARPVETNAPFISDDLRIFVISQLAPRTISDKEMKTRLEQYFHGFITKFIPLSERQSGNEENPADVKPMKFCTKCHKSFQASALWHHIYEFHLLCKPFVCADCPIARLSSEELAKHCSVKSHEPDVLSEFKILRKVFFGKEIKTALIKPEAQTEVITLSDSPLKPALKPSAPCGDPPGPLFSPPPEGKSKRPRMGVFTPCKKVETREVKNEVITSVSSSSDTTVVTTTATTTPTTTPTVATTPTAPLTTVTPSVGETTAPHDQARDETFRQKKARKTMPSGRQKESHCVVLTPTSEDRQPNVIAASVGKVRKRASMGGSSAPQKRRKLGFEEIQLDHGDESRPAGSSTIIDAGAETGEETRNGETLTATTSASSSPSPVPIASVIRKKTARKMMKSKLNAGASDESAQEKKIVDGEEPTVSVELAAFLKSQHVAEDVAVKELKKILKNYYLSAFLRLVENASDQVECALCDSSFKKMFLLHHVYRHHLKVKPFCCQDCPKRVTWSANLEKHCEESGHAADVESESRFIREFFKRYATVVAAAPPIASDSVEALPADGTTSSSAQTGFARNKVKRKGKEKEFKLDDVPWNLRPHVDDVLHEYISSRKLPRSTLTLDEYRWHLDSYFFGDCFMNPDRPPSHTISQAFLIECAKCDRFCSQSDYWTHIYGDHLRIAPFTCSGCDVSSASYSAVEVHCVENGGGEGAEEGKHLVKSLELTFLKYLFNRTACSAFMENPPTLDKTQCERVLTDNDAVSKVRGRVNEDEKRRSKKGKQPKIRDIAAMNAFSEQELAQMISPQAMRNFMYEQNRRKSKDIRFLSCDHGCDYKTKDVATYQQHIRRHNNLEGKFQCETEGCAYNVNDKAQMAAHSKYHHKSKEETLAFSNDHLDMLSLAPSESGLFECPHCEYVVYNKKATFLAHLSHHSMSSTAGQFYCSLCGYGGDAAEEIDNHIRAHHKHACGDAAFDEEEVAGTSRSGTQRRIQRLRTSNAKTAKDSLKTKQPLDPEDPAYREKLVAKYSSASLSISSLGLLTDEETNKRKKPQPPIPSVALRTAEWRHAFAAVSDAELETKVAAIIVEASNASSSAAVSNQRPKSRQGANNASQVKSTALLSLPEGWKHSPFSTATTSPKKGKPSASSTGGRAFSCRICPYSSQSDAEFERHVTQHASLNDLVEELAVAAMSDEGSEGEKSADGARKDDEGGGDASPSTAAVEADVSPAPSGHPTDGHEGCVGEINVGNDHGSMTDAPERGSGLARAGDHFPTSKSVESTRSRESSNALAAEITSFKCQFCCHFAKTPLVAQRHLQSHFKITSPHFPGPSTVAFASVEVDDIMKRVPGVAERAPLMNASSSSSSARQADSPPQGSVSAPPGPVSPPSTEVTPSSLEVFKPETLPEDLVDNIKIQGGRTTLGQSSELRKDIISRSIADFRSKIHETANQLADNVAEGVEDEKSSASTRDILEAVKAQTVALAEMHQKNASTAKIETEAGTAAETMVDQNTVDCSLCDAALRPDLMSSHAARHGTLDLWQMLENGDNDDDDDGLAARIRLKMASLRRVEKRELTSLLLDLEDDPVSETGASTALMSTCRFCCLELEPGKLQNHEARHLGIT